jgi:tRNA1Val (adenine37-N6)-methyltransferase
VALETNLADDEELDQLFDGRLKIIQKKEGYRFSIDAILLAHFAALIEAPSVIDLGTGSGIIPLVLARKTAAFSIVGVEVQERLARMAQRTIALNGLTDRISILHNDLRKVQDYLKPSSFDLVVCNPPYYPVTEGRINPEIQKAIARHEILATLQDVTAASHYLVKPEGVITIIFPAKRIIDFLHTLKQNGIIPKRLRVIYSTYQSEGKLVIIEAVKGGSPELVVEKPLYIYNQCGDYSEEMQTIYDEI